MDHLSKLTGQVARHLFLLFVFLGVVIAGGWWVAAVLYEADPVLVLIGLLALTVILSGVFALTTAHYLNEPVMALRQAIVHVLPEHASVNPPELQHVRLGRELVTSLALNVYELASGVASKKPPANQTSNEKAQLLLNNLPLPVIAISRDDSIDFINPAAQRYLGLTDESIVGQPAYAVLDISFSSDNTLENWLAEARQQKVTASKSWEHVRLKPAEGQTMKQFDLAAFYTKDSPSGIELILTLFDHSDRYNQDDEAASFVALAVHELRTPLTMLRGYIEVFEEEFEGKLDEELASFMRKMQASAQALTSFVNNILNVARVDADQLILQLHRENWEDIIRTVTADMTLKAEVHNKVLEITVASGLPEVAADRVSIYEVLNNLVDNAIKYSSDSQQKIIIKSGLTKDGLVETTVQDTGAGIPASVLPTLFQRFNRNHRNAAQIGGTGLGLYLSKAIIDAHGGNIWVRSKEGEGTTVGFTVKPYAMLADEQKNGDNKDIVRQAHGWIKNHSLYRR